MKNILRKLHLGANRDDQVDGGRSQQEAASGSSAATPFSSLTDWLSSVTKHNQPSPNNNDQAGNARARLERSGDSGTRGRPGGSTGSPIAKAPEYQSLEEEYQVQLAMALSVSNNESIDPEIEAVKRISLGLPPALAGSQAELAAYRYWAYNVINYDDKVVDGFYDVYGVVYDPDVPGKMPSLADLQGEPVSNVRNCEVVLVNRLTDPEISRLEQRAIVLLAECRGGKGGPVKSGLAQKIAELVAEQMGGPVGSDVDMLALWRTSSWELRSSLQKNVLPLGCLHIGLTRHRALLFKVLADYVGIPCRLVKGRHYTGVDEGAVNIIKDVDGREYIIDLMGAPGALIPPDVPVAASGPTGSIRDEKKHTLEHSSRASNLKDEALGEPHTKGSKNEGEKMPDANLGQRHHSEPADFDEALLGSERRTGPSHLRSPSWTEGIGSAAARQTKVKDVSQYMLDAAKENPLLAQKLHDVLRESGVVAPPELFAELSPKQLQDDACNEVKKGTRAVKGKDKGKPPLGVSRPNPVTVDEAATKERLQRLNSVEGLGDRRPLEPPLGAVNSSSVVSAATAASVLNAVQENFPAELIKHSPLAASAITAAVVASSMVVAAAKSDIATDGSLEGPITAAATATAAVVAATSAAVVLKSEGGSGNSDKGGSGERNKKNSGNAKPDDAGGQGSNRKLEENRFKGFTGSGDNVGRLGTSEEEKISNKSSRASSIADSVMEDVAEWEIPWEELVIGERIGLGSYGEVYRGDWHGTEVAVKKFLDQDISGDALEEFITEVRLMKRMRHPNVVLFMGAVTRPPNLSIVTEFLPRGSLFKLLHRPNNQLDERRRMRMALDVAKGMNYLHSSNPIIVHRDLKSPNLLVDKFWVVKVCDLGLSRMKHHTYLSSKSQAGTPEWMAPEVLRNEPSNEKADVYSFGVILWELATLQQPWQGMNPMQVVGAVGFQHRRLDIPADLDPNISKIIQECWHNDPQLRPSFAEIMNALRPFQRPIIASQSDSGREGLQRNQQHQRKVPGAELPANGLEEIPQAPT